MCDRVSYHVNGAPARSPPACYRWRGSWHLTQGFTVAVMYCTIVARACTPIDRQFPHRVLLLIPQAAYAMRERRGQRETASARPRAERAARVGSVLSVVRSARPSRQPNVSRLTSRRLMGDGLQPPAQRALRCIQYYYSSGRAPLAALQRKATPKAQRRVWSQTLGLGFDSC